MDTLRNNLEVHDRNQNDSDIDWRYDRKQAREMLKVIRQIHKIVLRIEKRLRHW
jgi:hypothetical protein